MTSKTRNHLRWLPSVVLAIFTTSGAIMKFTGAPQLAEQYAKIGMQENMALFAIVELCFMTLFLLPKTAKIGLLFLTGYYGGAMAVEFSLHMVFIFPATIL